MQITQLDHLVLTVANIEHSLDFYHRVLGMQVQTFGDNRKALAFGQQKINLHQRGNEFEPKAAQVQTGSADLCFLSDTPLDAAMAHVQACGVTIIEGPVPRTGAQGKLLSFYFRDPDGNLIEVANLIDD